jgi:hypothetical protein
VKQPTKKEIKAAIDKLKDKPAATFRANEPNAGKLAPKQNNQRIRKQGV